MSDVIVGMPRIEGGLQLRQGANGRVHLAGGQQPVYEKLMHHRHPLDAVQLTQHISLDAGISHGLAALKALEDAAGFSPSPNSLVLREVLHACSLVHAHIRLVYLQALPDYLSFGEDLSEPTNPQPNGKKKAPPQGSSWQTLGFSTPFSAREKKHLLQSVQQAQGMLQVLQRMLALLGGRFPIAMCLVPGGISTPLSTRLALQLETLRKQVAGFVQNHFAPDVDLLIARHPHLLTLGRGGETLFSVGGGLKEANFNTSLFTPGLLRKGRLFRLQGAPEESLAHARYQLVKLALEAGVLAIPDSQKIDATSWVKAPRWGGKSAEGGAVARLAVAFLTGHSQTSLHWVRNLEKRFNIPISQLNTVGGRILARVVETRMLLHHSQVQLETLDLGQRLEVKNNPLPKREVEGVGEVESPAGAVRHWMGIEQERIVFYDVIGASTWHGGSVDEAGSPSPLEAALNEVPHDLRLDKDLRLCSQIIHSFGFSMSDAIH